jgi:hypothetical protein
MKLLIKGDARLLTKSVPDIIGGAVRTETAIARRMHCLANAPMRNSTRSRPSSREQAVAL